MVLPIGTFLESMAVPQERPSLDSLYAASKDNRLFSSLVSALSWLFVCVREFFFFFISGAALTQAF